MESEMECIVKMALLIGWHRF